MGRAQSALADLPQHLRKLQQLRLAIKALHSCKRAVVLDELLDLEMLIAKCRQLRQVCDAEDLVVARQVPQLKAHHQPNTPTDALVDLIEDEHGDLVCARQ